MEWLRAVKSVGALVIYKSYLSMDVVTQNPTVLNFLLGFPQEDWAECVMMTALLGIQSLNGSRPTIAQLRTISNSATRKPPLLLTQNRPRNTSQTARNTRKPSPQQIKTQRAVPRHLRKVHSKISTQVRKDRELFRSLSKEHFKAELMTKHRNTAAQLPWSTYGADKMPHQTKVRHLNTRKKTVRPQVLEAPKDESFEALLNALSPSKPSCSQKKASASTMVRLMEDSANSSSSL